MRTCIRLLLALLFTAATLPSRAATVQVQILCTTDLHGCIEANDRAPGDTGGWLRLASVIAAQRQAGGVARTLLIDCGDTTQGSFISLFSRGQAAVDLLKALRYDAWTPGNHEFDFGARRAYDICRQLEPMLLCGNLEFIHDGRRERYPAWRLFTRDGARLAVIGATASYMEQWLWGHDVEGYKAEKAMLMLERVLPEIHKVQPDMIILAIHQGWVPEDPRKVNEVADIVRRFAEIDLVLGGHTHRDIPGMKVGAHTWYVQAGYHAASVAVVKATIDTDRHAVVDIVSELREPAPGTAPNPEALAVAQPYLTESQNRTRQPVAVLKTAVPPAGTPGETCAVSELFCLALVEATGADVAFHGKLAPAAGLPRGPVTAADVFAIVPFENTIGVATVSGADLRAIIAEQLTLRDNSSYNGLFGVEARATRDGRITALRYADGRDVPADATFKIALNSYAIAGGGGRFPVLRELLRRPEARLRDTGINSRDAVSTLLAKHPQLDLKPRRWISFESAAATPAATGD